MAQLPQREEFDRFLSEVTASISAHPEDAYRALSEMWRAATGATWVWFWSRNPRDGLWQLVAQSADCGFARVEEPLVPAVAGDMHCGADYVARTNEITAIEDISTWQREVDGVVYRVALLKHLQVRGCRSSLLVPIEPLGQLDPNIPEAEFRPSFFIVIVLHFTKPIATATVDQATLRTMSRLSSLRVSDAYERQARDISVRLARLAATCLSNRNAPQSERNDYLRGVVQLIQDHLRVSYISVFFETYTGDAIECAASTGLYDRDRRLVAPSEYRHARYSPTDASTATWKVYATGKVLLKPYGKQITHDQKYTELPPDKSESGVSWAIVPILRQSAGNGEPSVAGVIRCVDCVLVRELMCQHVFDEVELNLLQFIAAQVGPILDTMLVSSQRELTISIIKHDFYAPLRMIGDTVDSLCDLLGANKEVPPSKFDNLQVAVLVAGNLVSQLDVDPTRARVFSPSRTLLEGDIIARLKAMMSHYAYVENRMRIVFGDFTGVIPALNVDRVLIERVLFNLITNAVKYGKSSTTIEVVPRSDSHGFYVDVVNHGMGISAEEEKHIFKPGFRSPRATKMGAGLGLSIARAAMARHGGRLVLTAPRDPTVFTMVFPQNLAAK